MASTPNKPQFWLRGEVKTPPFSAEARVEAGYLLRRLLADESAWKRRFAERRLV
jgi:hypothetical protein